MQAAWAVLLLFLAATTHAVEVDPAGGVAEIEAPAEYVGPLLEALVVLTCKQCLYALSFLQEPQTLGSPCGCRLHIACTPEWRLTLKSLSRASSSQTQTFLCPSMAIPETTLCLRSPFCKRPIIPSTGSTAPQPPAALLCSWRQFFLLSLPFHQSNARTFQQGSILFAMR